MPSTLYKLGAADAVQGFLGELGDDNPTMAPPKLYSKLAVAKMVDKLAASCGYKKGKKRPRKQRGVHEPAPTKRTSYRARLAKIKKKKR